MSSQRLFNAFQRTLPLAARSSFQAHTLSSATASSSSSFASAASVRSFASNAHPATPASHDSHGSSHGGAHDSHGAHGAGAHGHDHHGVEFEGVAITPPKPWQKYGAHFFGGLMWFWIIYRFSNDYKVFLGLEHPWDGHHGDAHDSHGTTHASAGADHDDDEEEEHADAHAAAHKKH